ncbi:MAG TPA: glycosyl hydrolase [Polyangiaceae bacterium]|nr:glycosyl hydrolase [Polyangiaceae bacterium]
MKKLVPSSSLPWLQHFARGAGSAWVLAAAACGGGDAGSEPGGVFEPQAPMADAPAPAPTMPEPAAPLPLPDDATANEGLPTNIQPPDALPSTPAGAGAAAECTDVAPDATFTCVEQAGWGKCGEAWMQDRCNASCGRCVPGGVTPPSDAVPPDTVPPDAVPPDAVPPVIPLPAGVAPVTPNASPQVRNLLAFLYAEYGKHMLSGQMESTWMPGGADYEIDYVEAVTGTLPAIRGLDFIEYDGVAQRTIEWWERGGIANIRWHWGAPTHGQGYEASQEAVDIDRVLMPGTAEYDSMMDGLERTADELAIIRDAGVPVLWTPFHELNGNWFWWGKEGPEQFIRLWRFMFDYLAVQRGLNNLVWVLGYTGQPNGAWYPGKEYVDVAGADSYGRTEQPQLGMFNAVRNIVGNAMPVAYHENGIIPSAALAREQGATWSWFMTWHTDWLTDENTQQHIRDVFADDFVLTLDELPSLR